MRLYHRTLSIVLPALVLLSMSQVGCYMSETGLCWNTTQDVARPFDLPTEPDRTVLDADTFTDSEGTHDTTMMLEIWDCTSPAWWYDAPPRKVVFEYHNSNACARFDTVRTWELQCGEISEVELQHGDLDLDGVTLASGDCDESAPDRHPGAVEYCNDGIDQDCDGLDALGDDRDQDGFNTCETDQLDCDDQSADIFPGAEEVCDGMDNDCDGATDEGVVVPLTYDALQETEVNDLATQADLLIADETGYFRVQGSISSAFDYDYFRFQWMGAAGQTMTLGMDLSVPQEGPEHSIQLLNASEEYQNATVYTQTDGILHAEFSITQDDTGQTMWYAVVKGAARSCDAYLLEIAPLVN